VARWWTPGEDRASARLAEFSAGAIADYDAARDLPAVHGTSELSPHIAWGEVSPRQLLAAASSAGEEEARSFVRQLAWREFAYHVLNAHPTALERAIDARFEGLGWCSDPEGLAAWKAGRTGYPLVDAGMRQLALSGWMHNRARLVCASFLTKDLLVAWQLGEQHFREKLVDYDPALNAFNWQWVAGCGTDAAPYFRIFNPTLQGTRFDKGGAYVRRWVPELAALPDRWIHRPFDAPGDVLAAAGVTIGTTYPVPLVSHAEARARALAAYAAIR
jgi:deoxyribodipyrimidine photo-lyase